MMFADAKYYNFYFYLFLGHHNDDDEEEGQFQDVEDMDN